jgi:hypothetical protein
MLLGMALPVETPQASHFLSPIIGPLTTAPHALSQPLPAWKFSLPCEVSVDQPLSFFPSSGRTLPACAYQSSIFPHIPLRHSRFLFGRYRPIISIVLCPQRIKPPTHVVFEMLCSVIKRISKAGMAVSSFLSVWSM